MEFLKLLESIRTPIFDEFFSLITHFGEEILFIVFAILFYWCFDKKKGLYLLFVGFIGTIVNQFLKIICRIERPWVQDKNFTIVESARAEATGYSFPSGHTQMAIGLYGGIARVEKTLWIRIVCIALCVLVPFSRLYLGVHTPLDVGVSIAIGLVLVFGLFPLLNKIFEDNTSMRIFFIGCAVLSLAFYLFTALNKFPADVDAENLAHAIENAAKMFGCVLGVWVGFEIERKYVKFETKAVWWVQIIKVVAGLIPIILIKSLLKNPLISLFGDPSIAGIVRYFILTAFACCVWPMTFKFWNKLCKK